MACGYPNQDRYLVIAFLPPSRKAVHLRAGHSLASVPLTRSPASSTAANCREQLQQEACSCKPHFSRSRRRVRSARTEWWPSFLALLRLITSSNLIGYPTWVSPGFSLRRILSTYLAAHRNRCYNLCAVGDVCGRRPEIHTTILKRKALVFDGLERRNWRRRRKALLPVACDRACG